MRCVVKNKTRLVLTFGLVWNQGINHHYADIKIHKREHVWETWETAMQKNRTKRTKSDRTHSVLKRPVLYVPLLIETQL